MKSKQEFLDYYESLVSNDIELQEKQSKAPKIRFDKKWLFLLFIFPVLFFLITMVMLMSENPAFLILNFLALPVLGIILIVLIIMVGIPYYQRHKVIKYFESKYKDQLIKFLLEDKMFLYEKEKFVKKQDFNDSKMFTSYNRYTGEDLVSLVVPCQIGEIVIRFSDLSVKKETKDSKGNTSTTTIFSGVFGYAQFSKQFDFKLGVNNGFWKYEKISLESIDFNKRFKIYSNDQITARLIFTPDRMEKLLNKNLSNKISAHLFDNRIYFAFHGEKLFDTILRNDNNQISIDDLYHDIQSLNELIDEMKKILNDIY